MIANPTTNQPHPTLTYNPADFPKRFAAVVRGLTRRQWMATLYAFQRSYDRSDDEAQDGLLYWQEYCLEMEWDYARREYL